MSLKVNPYLVQQAGKQNASKAGGLKNLNEALNSRKTDAAIKWLTEKFNPNGDNPRRMISKC